MNGAAAFSDGPGGGQAVRRITGFVRLLRDNGFPLGIREGLDALRFAETSKVTDQGELRWGLRALLCASQTDWRRFDEIFDGYWRGRGVKRLARVSGDSPRRTPFQALGDAGPRGPASLPDRVERGIDGGAAGGDGRREGASAVENLARTDLRHINDPDQLARVHDLTARLAARMKYRLTRRDKVRARGRRLDLRGTIHRSIPTGGVPLRLAFRRRRPKPLRLVVILDASGSMSQYSAFFVRFIHGVMDNFREAAAFAFHTRLVHLSHALKDRNVERAIDRMALLATGWSGGTRIGAALADFNRNYAASLLSSRSVVIIVSDGYDTDPPELLGRELAQLKRRTKRLVWLNPMIGWPGYEPLAGGMAAALPYIDLFAPAHNLASLMALEPYLVRL